MDELDALMPARVAAAGEAAPSRADPLVLPRLLVSVRDAADARAALQGGADIIDVKEPSRGPLGMAEAHVIAEVVRTVTALNPAASLSAALGETQDWIGCPDVPVVLPELDYVKLGLSGLAGDSDWERVWTSVRARFEQQAGRPLNWIAVAYADHGRAGSPPVREVIRGAARTGCRGVLIDTWCKDRPGLTACAACAEIRNWVQDAHGCGLLIALAGRLRGEDLSVLSLQCADILGVRSAACVAGDRRSPISPGRVAELRRALSGGARNESRRVAEAADLISRRWPRRPAAGIILGTGLGRFEEVIQTELCLEYGDVPHFAPSTAEGHAGRLVCGLVEGLPVVALAGRAHLYEGCSIEQITRPVRVLHLLGIERLIVSNAAGGLNPQLAVGDLVLIDDHLDLAFAPSPPVAGGMRCISNSLRAYDAELIAVAEEAARREGICTVRGTYAAVSGPNYETRAEYRMYRGLGADVIGMSTVPEVTVAAELGVPVLAISAVTNVCNPDAPAGTDGSAVAAAAAEAEWKLRRIVLAAFQSLRRESAQQEIEHGAEQ